MTVDNPPPKRRRTVISDVAGVSVAGTEDGRPADVLAGALPAWDLLPATQFIHRR